MSIPFLNKTESEIFAKSLNDFMVKANSKKMLAYMSSDNMYTLHHGSSFSSTDNNESELTKHAVNIEFEYSNIRLYKIEQLYVFINDFIEQMSSQMTKTLYQTLSDTCEKTGNVIDAKQEAMSFPNMFLEMIKRIEFSVDKDGKVLIPEVHLPPGNAKRFMAELESQGEEYLNLIEEIQKEKSEQAIKKENERLLKFEGVTFE